MRLLQSNKLHKATLCLLWLLSPICKGFKAKDHVFRLLWVSRGISWEFCKSVLLFVSGKDFYGSKVAHKEMNLKRISAEAVAGGWDLYTEGQRKHPLHPGKLAEAQPPPPLCTPF